MGRLGDWEMGRLAEEKVVRLNATWYESSNAPATIPPPKTPTSAPPYA